MTPTADTDTPLNEIKLLETFLSQIPKNMVEAHERRMLANYFTCSNMAVNIHCLERLVCELHSPQSVTMPLEANVLSIIVNKIITNDYVPFDTKLKITRAIEEGRKSRCDAYKCETLEGYKSLRRLQ
ncbi:hypothetical protein RUM43_014053 [Polyplax serrata]|uniref:Uncharacterized protein n=1 Tax=Polyplax serrata TaxID=468196 RepID=A0AAN8P096_POLSC